jgi:hypothetical protein
VGVGAISDGRAYQGGDRRPGRSEKRLESAARPTKSDRKYLSPKWEIGALRFLSRIPLNHNLSLKKHLNRDRPFPSHFLNTLQPSRLSMIIPAPPGANATIACENSLQRQTRCNPLYIHR